MHTGKLYPAVDDPAGLLAEQIVPLPNTPVWTTPDPALDTPYAIASQLVRPRRGTAKPLVEMSKSLEAKGAAAGKSMIVVGTFQHAQHFTPRHLAALACPRRCHRIRRGLRGGVVGDPRRQRPACAARSR